LLLAIPKELLILESFEFLLNEEKAWMALLEKRETL